MISAVPSLVCYSNMKTKTMETNSVSICCNVHCTERFTCAKFARALDVNSGKIKANYYEVEKCEYER